MEEAQKKAEEAGFLLRFLACKLSLMSRFLGFLGPGAFGPSVAGHLAEDLAGVDEGNAGRSGLTGRVLSRLRGPGSGAQGDEGEAAKEPPNDDGHGGHLSCS